MMDRAVVNRYFGNIHVSRIEAAFLSYVDDNKRLF
tara:strand:+ start:4850 stop:4954 length:105 start_codon:yes stop_codon:yes gene_type:complete